MINYYELKYLVTETFYENILQEKYTIGQSAGRCFVEFYVTIQYPVKYILIFRQNRENKISVLSSF